MSGHRHSLQRRLAWHLALVFVAAATAMFVGLLVRGMAIVESAQDRELLAAASEVARSATAGTGESGVGDRPSGLAALTERGRARFVVRDETGAVLAESDAQASAVVGGWPPPADLPRYYEVAAADASGSPLYGVIAQVETATGPVWVSLAEPVVEGESFVHRLFEEFFADISWMVVLLVAVTLLVGYWTLRGGLRPLRAISDKAAAIRPGAADVRLPDQGIPAEIVPLIQAVNGALERLDDGLKMQRQFTGNAAHQLRTPLAVLTARLDLLGSEPEVEVIRGDVRRMGRIVDQLLKMARLDSSPLRVPAAVDLHKIASDVVSYLAPLAIRDGRALALSGTAVQVLVAGDESAINDAITNLVENALTYAPAGGTVEVDLARDGTLEVRDRGPGIPVALRAKVFERFWRGAAAPADGAGLGLAIVAEVARRHQTRVEIADLPGGGTAVRIRWPLLGPDCPQAPPPSGRTSAP